MAAIQAADAAGKGSSRWLLLVVSLSLSAYCSCWCWYSEVDTRSKELHVHHQHFIPHFGPREPQKSTPSLRSPPALFPVYHASNHWSIPRVFAYISCICSRYKEISQHTSHLSLETFTLYFTHSGCASGVESPRQKKNYPLTLICILWFCCSNSQLVPPLCDVHMRVPIRL